MRSDSLREEYFADARRFRPERWLGAEGGHGAASANRIAMPFGAGPRVCPGRHLAMLEIKMALAVLLGRFDIESVATRRRRRAAGRAVVHDVAGAADDAPARRR